MKYIKKTQPPPSLTACKKKKPQMNWEILCRQEYASTKAQLANYLRTEQGFICCYCESEIVRGESHIEHFKPKSLYPSDDLDYFNLFASCNGGDSHENLSCGMKKRNLYFARLLKPSDPTCESRFIYTADGQILPTDENDDDAWQTIAVLGLNGPKLRRRRAMVYEELENLRLLMLPEDFQEYIELRLALSSQHHFCEFWTTVKYFGTSELL